MGFYVLEVVVVCVWCSDGGDRGVAGFFFWVVARVCVVVGWWLLSHVVVDVEIEIEKKRGKIEMGEEREMSFFF